ncbi:MAG: hypothetical protein HC914_17760, partial [Chloroflexaceae bacterium]|nr:hypothetical protein [Chloroflexaceae bacterium]
METTPPVRLSEPPAERLALTATDALTLTGTSNNARFGAAASTAGDVNGDGFADLLIGVPGESAVQVYYGSATGISSTPDTTLSGAGNFGRAVSIAGDINNDGFADVIIGTPGQNTAALFRGAATGISTTPLELSQPGGFGASVATAGDVDGDGFDDVLVGAPNTDLVYLFSGASLAADQTDPTVTLSGSGNFGTALDTAGDVNGDGFADIVVGAPGDNASYVYLGATAGLSTTASFTVTLGGGAFGTSVGTAGDMNGDGFSEIVVGAPISDTIFIYPGSSLGLSSTLVLTATQPGAFGQAVGTAGDVNGDGLSDILIGAPDFAAAAEDIGGAFLYLGTLDILARDPEETFVISGTGSAFGSVVNTAGDLNGDGFADLVIGAPTFANVGANRGLARLYYGSAAEVSERPDWSDVRLGQSLARFYGRMVATAGDLNGDGYDEVAISTARSDQTNASSVRVFMALILDYKTIFLRLWPLRQEAPLAAIWDSGRYQRRRLRRFYRGRAHLQRSWC